MAEATEGRYARVRIVNRQISFVHGITQVDATDHGLEIETAEHPGLVTFVPYDRVRAFAAGTAEDGAMAVIYEDAVLFSREGDVTVNTHDITLRDNAGTEITITSHPDTIIDIKYLPENMTTLIDPEFAPVNISRADPSDDDEQPIDYSDEDFKDDMAHMEAPKSNGGYPPSRFDRLGPASHHEDDNQPDEDDNQEFDTFDDNNEDDYQHTLTREEAGNLLGSRDPYGLDEEHESRPFDDDRRFHRSPPARRREDRSAREPERRSREDRRDREPARETRNTAPSRSSREPERISRSRREPERETREEREHRTQSNRSASTNKSDKSKSRNAKPVRNEPPARAKAPTKAKEQEAPRRRGRPSNAELAERARQEELASKRSKSPRSAKPATKANDQDGRRRAKSWHGH